MIKDYTGSYLSKIIYISFKEINIINLLIVRVFIID